MGEPIDTAYSRRSVLLTEYPKQYRDDEIDEA